MELNRRLAPDVYLGVSSVSGAELPPWPAGRRRRPVEHLVVMRRMPDDRRLSTLVRAGAPVRDHLRALARSVAAFHAAARRGPESPPRAAATRSAAVGRRTSSRYGRSAPVPAPETVDAVDRLAARFLAGRGPLFADRCADGRIVDGHGDLIADDVFCLDDGPRALDCLEFDDKLRYVDGLDDVAFLAMDLERLGRPDLADDWLDAYVEFSGDPAPVALRHHYVAYRAFVRAKVACLRHQQGDAAAATDAAQYADLSLRHLEAGAVRLALVGGLPGTGKTTVGGALADRFGAVLLSSDRLRKELAGLSPTQPAPAAYGEGLYTADAPTRCTRSCCTGPGSCSPAASRWCSTRRGRTRGTGWPPRNWPGARTATWSAWSAAPPPTSPPHASRAAAPPPRTRRPPSGAPWPPPPTRGRTRSPCAPRASSPTSLHRAAQAWQAAPTRTEVHPWRSGST